MQCLDVHIAKRDAINIFEGFIRQNHPAALRAILQTVLRPAEALSAAIFKFMGRVDMGDNLNSLICPIGISEHSMPLAILIDHKSHGLICQGFNLRMQCCCEQIRATSIDHHNPVAGEDET